MISEMSCWWRTDFLDFKSCKRSIDSDQEFLTLLTKDEPIGKCMSGCCCDNEDDDVDCRGFWGLAVFLRRDA